jgi:hypothetical protein
MTLVRYLIARSRTLPGRILYLQIPYALKVDPVPPAVVSKSDEGIVAAWAADDGAHLPNLVDHRRADLINPPAPLAGVLRGGHLKGEDFPERARRRVAIQPEFVVHRCSNLPWVQSARSLRVLGRAPGLPARLPLPPPEGWDRRRR